MQEDRERGGEIMQEEGNGNSEEKEGRGGI